jgi:iron complex outermembrane receptor protein
MVREKELARAIALIGLAGASISQVVMADDNQAVAPQKMEKIEVIGSNIKRVSTETSSPVQVLTREAIEQQGFSTITQVINNLAAATGNNTLSDIGNGNSFAPGASSAGLRNLGEQSTLVLLNGRRVAPNALADYNLVFVNLDAFPIDAVERVEVLKSGASAIYGSDAVAGVINIVTRKDYSGVDVRASREQSITSGQFGTTTASITAGKGDVYKDGYNVFFNLDAFHRDAVDWKPLVGYQNPALVKLAPSYDAPSTYSPHPNVYDQETGAVAYLGTCGTDKTSIKGVNCVYDRTSQFQAVDKSDRFNGYLGAQFKINDGLNAFAEASFSQDKTTYKSAYYTYAAVNSVLNWNNPQTGAPLIYLPVGLNGSSPLNPFAGDSIDMRYRFTDVPNIQNTDNKQFRVLGGLKGSWGDYDWESAVGVMGSRETDIQRGAFPSASAWDKYIGCASSLNCVTADPNSGIYVSNDPNYFNQPGGYKIGGGNSDAVLNALFPNVGFTGQYTQSFWDGKVSGPLATLSAGTLSYAVGAELRNEKFTITPTDNLKAGDIVANGFSAADASRTFGAMYGELSVPILKNLESQIAARVDKFPGFDAHISPKIGLKWDVNNSLAFRATVERGFRAPNLVESATSSKVSYSAGNSDPKRCDASNALANDLLNAYYNTSDPALAAQILAKYDSINDCSESVANVVKNNPNLKPETSDSYSLGMVFEPIRGFSGAIDYWNIKRSNTISQLSAQQVLAQEGNLPAGTTLTRFPFSTASDPTFSAHDALLGGQNDFDVYGVPSVGQIQQITSQFENIYSQKTNGVDFNLHGKWNNTRLGRIDVDLNGTYLISYHDAQIAPISENLAGNYGFSRISSDLTVGMNKGAHSASIRLNYVGGTSLNTSADDAQWTPSGCAAQKLPGWTCHVPSSTTADVYYGYSGIKNLSLSFAVRNVFDRYAATDIRAFGGKSAVLPAILSDARGRMLRVSAEYKFF